MTAPNPNHPPLSPALVYKDPMVGSEWTKHHCSPAGIGGKNT